MGPPIVKPIDTTPSIEPQQSQYIPDGEMDMSDDRMQSVAKMGESHGIKVSQSLGLDDSVDSLALEDYDRISYEDQQVNNPIDTSPKEGEKG